MNTYSTLNDEDLIRSAQLGELDAFNELYERYLPTVYRRVRYMIPEQDVDDVTQEVFIAVVRSLKSFRGESLFSTWLRTLIKRQIADFYRRRGPVREEVDIADQADRDLELGDKTNYTQVDDCMMVRQALRRLPEKYMDILLLRFAEGMMFQEIAQFQGQSLDATKSLFRRAVAALQKQMEEANA